MSITDSSLSAGKGSIETIIDPQSDKIAVIELSTRAVKLLVGNDLDALRSGAFDFRHFSRHSARTDTGRGIDKDGYMDMDFFCQRVLPAIVNARRSASQMLCGKIYTVATAAYRMARNSDQLLEAIRREAGLNAHILSREEEAMGAITAYQFTTGNRAALFSHPRHIMVDQGGASTEVSVFDNGECVLADSINLGTEMLKSAVFNAVQEGAPLMRAIRLAIDKAAEIASPMLAELPEPDANAMCIAVGSAITSATGLIGSPAQHDKVLTLAQIESAQADATDRLTARFPLSADILKATDRRTDELLTMALGLPLYARLLRRLGLSHLTVSGTGLWYGIYYRQLFNL